MPRLLQAGGLAVVGSRDASEEDIEFARSVAAACASQNIPVISGGARGVDLEAMAAGFEAGGKAVGVLPDSLARNAVSARYREGLVSGRLVLVSPYDPDARWFAFTAMERNKVIYALSDAALVVSSAAENGGTWAGAVEALDAARDHGLRESARQREGRQPQAAGARRTSVSGRAVDGFAIAV